MKTAKSSARTRELALIHIGAQQLGLRQSGDDSAYRQMLWAVARVKSAADLDEAGRQRIIDHLRSCGWQDTARPAGRPRSRYQKGTQAALIRWLWTQLHRAGHIVDNRDRALRRYIAQHAGIVSGVDELAPQHLDKRQARIVIEQMKNWLERDASPEPDER